MVRGNRITTTFTEDTPGFKSQLNHLLHVCCACAKLLQSCLTLCATMDCSLPGSSVHGIFLARILEWVAISFSRVSSWPRDRTCFSCISFIGRWILYHWAIWEALPQTAANSFSLELFSLDYCNSVVTCLIFFTLVLYSHSPAAVRVTFQCENSIEPHPYWKFSRWLPAEISIHRLHGEHCPTDPLTSTVLQLRSLYTIILFSW